MSSGETPAGVTVIGAGIVGILTALALRRDGLAVTVIDEGEPGKACSFGNGGAIGPESCTPFALPGMLSKIPRWLLESTGPVSIDPFYLPRAAPWLLRWVLAGRMDRARASARAMRALHLRSLELYREVLGPADFGNLMRTTGSLFVYESNEPGTSERNGRDLQQEMGVTPVDLTAGDIRDMEPGLAPVFRRGVLLPGNAFTVSPSRLLATLTDNFRAAGGKMVRGRVTGFEVGNGGPRALRTEGGPVAVDRLVIAAGAWSGRLIAQLGLRVPLEAERGYHVLLPEAGVTLRNKVMNGSRGFGMTPMEDGLQITGTVEIAGVDAAPDPRRPRALLVNGRRMLPGLREAGMTTWLGRRPSLPDSLPVLDRMPGHSRVFLAFGHSHWGLSGAPMSGEIIAAMIAGRTPPIDAGPYRATRF